MTTTKRYYAAQSPRGFANEVNVYAFSSKAERHADDGDVNSAYLGGYAVTRAVALRLGGEAIDGAGFPIRGKVDARFVR